MSDLKGALIRILSVPIYPHELADHTEAVADYLIDNDVFPVVRCKECKNISPSVTPMRETVWCRKFRAYMPCDGFCSYGERRATNEAD